MQDFKTQFEYFLKVPFSYASKGDMVSATKLIVKAPTNTVLSHTTTLEQALSAAQDGMLEHVTKLIGKEAVEKRMESAGDNVEDLKKQAKSLEETGESIVEMLFRGKGDIQACFKALQSILTSSDSTRQPYCVVDAETPMTSMIFNSMSIQDSKGLLGEYIKNFIIASPSN